MDHRPSRPVARRVAPLALAALLALAGAASAAAAQGTIRGVLHDSLRARGPVAGAQVALLGANRRAVTDAEGRFEFTDVPAGRATVAWWSPWLDSLALPPLQAVVEVGGDVQVRLSTPSRAAYQVAVCGAPLGADEGILIGELRDAEGRPLEGVAVGARWRETLVGVGQLERRLRAALDTANATGFWSLCGVPTDAEFGLVAGDDTIATGEILVSLAGEPVMRRDLIAGRRDVTARIRGRLLGPDSLPLAGATVVAEGDTATRARSDAEGRFVLDGVPRRSGQLVARAIGFVPTLRALDPLDAEVELDDIVLARMPQELSSVTITGEPLTADKLQFDTRRARGVGQFAGEEELARIPIISANTLTTLMRGVTAVGSGRNRRLMLNRTSFGGGALSTTCMPRWFQDGFEVRNPDQQEEEQMLQRAKRIEVYTAAEAPARYNDFDGCGVVLIWTR